MSDTKNINTWEDLFTQEDTNPVPVPLPSGRVVFMQPLTANRILEWFRDQQDDEKAKTNGLVLVAESLVSENGTRIGKLDDIVKLREKTPDVLQVLREAALSVNGIEVKLRENPSSEPTA